eukprot:gnl/TRDRNA2_/TRDRNA2_165352_c0_seq1.p1 gnl/TRDRNA2_/TRDRNA2_165352_c0~~gnl/TRDRNA2_/TRDRNA2_165352_c0_seq1.p1  ORF type:complete len:112 (-),score=13.17 gnl/TRDRNA2_/TRDRNA2_165352_c0_seq1:152-487(-)
MRMLLLAALLIQGAMFVDATSPECAKAMEGHTKTKTSSGAACSDPANSCDKACKPVYVEVMKACPDSGMPFSTEEEFENLCANPPTTSFSTQTGVGGSILLLLLTSVAFPQ